MFDNNPEGHTNKVSCSSDKWPQKIGASERFDNYNIIISYLQNFQAIKKNTRASD